MQRVALDLGQVQRAQLLVAVLAAAEVVEVGAVGVEPLAEAARTAARSRSPASGSAARARAGCRGRRRCSSGPGTARTRAARWIRRGHAGSPPRCRRSRAVSGTLARSAPRTRRRGPRARARAAVRRSRRIRSCSTVRSPAGRTVSRRRSSTNPPRSARTAIGWLEYTTPSISRMSGSGIGMPSTHLVQVEHLGDRHRQHPAGPQVAVARSAGTRRARRRLRAAGSSASARCTGGTAVAEVELARVRHDRVADISRYARVLSPSDGRGRRSGLDLGRARSRDSRPAPGPAPRGPCRRRRRARGRRTRPPASATAAGPRRSCRTRGRARSRSSPAHRLRLPEPDRVPARGQLLAQLEQRGVGRQDVQPRPTRPRRAPRRAPARAPA